MDFIYSDEILKDFVRLSEQQKVAADERIDFDESQFDLISDKNNDLAVDGPVTFVSAALLSNAKDDAKTILEKKYPIEPEDLIEKAHPEPVMVAEHPVGGLVENQNEQHQRMLNVVNKMPTGFPLNSWAALASSLVKIAQECDDLGLEREAEELDQVVSSFFLVEAKKDMAVPGGIGGALMKLVTGPILAIAPFLGTPWTAGIAIALAIGGVAFWTMWDGIKEDLHTDIKDLIDKLDNYNADPDFTGVAGFQQIYSAAKKMLALHEELMSALADKASTKDTEVIAKVADLYNKIGDQIDIMEANFAIFKSVAPKNLARSFSVIGFGDLGGQIENIADQYSDLGETADLKRLKDAGDAATAPEHDKSAEGLVPGAHTKEIKSWLKANDVSKMIGYAYDIDDSDELDETTVRIMSDLGDKIRRSLGTNVPSTKDLLSTSYNGLEAIMQIYEEPWTFVKTK